MRAERKLSWVGSLGRRWARMIRLGMLALMAVAGRAEPVTLNYWLWDVGQLPAYQAVAREFEVKNPDIRIKITQIGWLDYWISLTTAMVSDTAPDVFANHITRYPELVRYRTLLDLAPRVERDRVDVGGYLDGLYAMWTKDGGQYGLPKDWDTIALVFNRELLAEAGVDPAELDNLDWNPRDGGTFGRMIARLSRDREGRDGQSADYDKTAVAHYGLLLDGEIDATGQVGWANFASANGFRFDDGPWSQTFHYDDPHLAETLTWLRDASLQRGWIVPARDARQMAANGLFAARRGALAMTGSWFIGWYARNSPFAIGYAPLPVGPEGRRTMLNGLADSIWSGTRHPEEAWRWVKFLGSHEGQMIVAEHGVVFPAQRDAADRATVVMAARGADVSVFLRQALAPGGTLTFPLAGEGSDLQTLGRAAMDDIFLDDAPIVERLEILNRQVNALYAPRR